LWIFAAFLVGATLVAPARGEVLATTKTSAPAQAGIDAAKVQARRDTLFQRMIEKPDDLDAAFEYAALSVQIGDLEAAISTLERMLVFAPGLPRLQLELGVLYYRLSAFETARSYFEAAVSAPDVPHEVRDKVGQYLGAIDKAGEATRFSGQLRTGIRYQTNANRVTTDGTIVLNGLPFIVAPGARGAPDWNVYGAGFFHLSHDLPSQGDTLEADLVAYGSKQFKLDHLDTAIAELTVGPAFDLGRFGIENGAAGLYGIGSLAAIDQNYYSGAIGLGGRLVLFPAPGLSSVTSVEYRYRGYNNSTAAPAAELRNGDEIRAYTRLSYVINPTVAVAATAYVQQTQAERPFLAYTEAGLAGSVSIAFNAPFNLGTGPWIISPNAGLIHREFDGPDPVVNTLVAERDTETFVGASLLVPLKDDWGILAETEYRNFDSNYPLFEFDDFSVSLSFVKSF
jgi:tetratricopeptide (TPR) repeat protein